MNNRFVLLFFCLFGSCTTRLIRYYPNGQVQEIYHVKQGGYVKLRSSAGAIIDSVREQTLEGSRILFDSLGRKVSKKNYQKNAIEGSYTTWFANGQVHLKGFESTTTGRGTFSRWDSLGRLECKGVMNRTEWFDPLTFEQKYRETTECYEMYYPNGQLRFQCPVIENHLRGTAILYDSLGKYLRTDSSYYPVR
jgi:antitoxin component YwqK of YwqJK toxin-antitoxin module